MARSKKDRIDSKRGKNRFSARSFVKQEQVRKSLDASTSHVAGRSQDARMLPGAASMRVYD
jgi:hypothetical protein